jgi:regulator of RNase E activity RraB
MSSLGEDIIHQLREYGLDVNQRYTLEFFFYFDNDDNAEDAMDVLNHQGFDVTVPAPADTHQWVIKAQIALVPATHVDTLNEWEKTFHAIAKQYEGEFDGWGAGSG